MDKINLVKLNEALTYRKQHAPVRFDNIRDSFELSANNKSAFIDLATTMFVKDDYFKITNNLKQFKMYGGALCNITHIKDKDGKLLSVNVSLYNPNTAEFEEVSLKHDEYIDFLTHLTAKQIERNPEKEDLFKKEYLELVKIVKSISVN